jgi:Ham1 family protein
LTFITSKLELKPDHKNPTKYIPNPHSLCTSDNMASTPPLRPVVNFITGNPNKLREVVAVLEPAIEVHNQPLDLVEIQGTMEEVTTDKCKRAAEAVRFSFSPPSPPGIDTNR